MFNYKKIIIIIGLLNVVDVIASRCKLALNIKIIKFIITKGENR